MLSVLILLKGNSVINITPGITGYFFCGILWGISFVVPGLSSSTMLLFFGIYQPMLNGIAHFSLNVIVPLAVGMALCLIALPKLVNKAFEKSYSVISHAILGIIAATTVMIIPDFNIGFINIIIYILCIAFGAVTSYILSKACARLASPQKEQEPTVNLLLCIFFAPRHYTVLNRQLSISFIILKQGERS